MVSEEFVRQSLIFALSSILFGISYYIHFVFAALSAAMTIFVRIPYIGRFYSSVLGLFGYTAAVKLASYAIVGMGPYLVMVCIKQLDVLFRSHLLDGGMVGAQFGFGLGAMAYSLRISSTVFDMSALSASNINQDFNSNLMRFVSNNDAGVVYRAKLSTFVDMYCHTLIALFAALGAFLFSYFEMRYGLNSNYVEIDLIDCALYLVPFFSYDLPLVLSEDLTSRLVLAFSGLFFVIFSVAVVAIAAGSWLSAVESADVDVVSDNEIVANPD
ncbi:hypothetical protein [Pontivivens insulae]|uniref:Uncharacterized protein n=1 Tax=Pontivivens insulae TaxID=1639689 RepID=A0A2R8A694_9RHOB|nr:hypothetical protein [Pontivivens insulae]RED17871.1 hypothetical protein DFR53_0056 [Pontivivens insulae]SPF27761.1 hypothetical protein POI8812_00054 [Pontivivens insulae]